jgi:hypothetical protein
VDGRDEPGHDERCPSSKVTREGRASGMAPKEVMAWLARAIRIERLPFTQFSSGDEGEP